MNAFEAASAAVFSESYPGAHARLQHKLQDHPLLSLDRLLLLSQALPQRSIEYNAGDLPIGQRPDETPMNGLSPEETIRRIAENKSWLVLKNIEQDGAFEALLNEILGDFSSIVRKATGEMHKCEGFLFISSPGSVTPFHMDPEHNILMQIRGSKTFHLFSSSISAIVSDEQHEDFHRQDGHRNLPYRDEFEKYDMAISLTPGDALYVPVKTPHWVKVGPEVSISLSVTWRSKASDREARLRQANGWLRAHGRTPPPIGKAPLRDALAVLGARLAAKLGQR